MTTNKNFFVRIFEDGDGESTPTLVVFNSLAEKEKYIKKEYWFCKQEEVNCLSARYKEQRVKAKKDLFLKRVVFAKSEGFKPIDKKGNKWYKSQSNDRVA
jgi:hypothetical protein